MSRTDDVIGYAQAELGKPYVWGDEGPNTFDCSGLMQWIFAKVGVVLPRTAAEQQDWATRVTSPTPGDMVFYGDPAYHVALYIGGGKQIAAPAPGAKVRVEDMGAATSYGRVPGLGAALAPIVGVAGALVSPVTSWLAGGRHIALEGAFVVLGLALLGYGAYRVVRPTVTSTLGGAGIE
jgi:hypothetical protein